MNTSKNTPKKTLNKVKGFVKEIGRFNKPLAKSVMEFINENKTDLSFLDKPSLWFDITGEILSLLLYVEENIKQVGMKYREVTKSSYETTFSNKIDDSHFEYVVLSKLRGLYVLCVLSLIMRNDGNIMPAVKKFQEELSNSDIPMMDELSVAEFVKEIGDKDSKLYGAMFNISYLWSYFVEEGGDRS